MKGAGGNKMKGGGRKQDEGRGEGNKMKGGGAGGNKMKGGGRKQDEGRVEGNKMKGGGRKQDEGRGGRKHDEGGGSLMQYHTHRCSFCKYGSHSKDQPTNIQAY